MIGWLLLVGFSRRSEAASCSPNVSAISHRFLLPGLLSTTTSPLKPEVARKKMLPYGRLYTMNGA
jgi:hypothetical protein